MTNNIKSAWIQIRVSKEDKLKLVKEAQKKQLSLSKWMLEVAIENCNQHEAKINVDFA